MYKLIGSSVLCLCVIVAAIIGNKYCKDSLLMSSERLRDTLVLRQLQQQKFHRMKNSINEPLLSVLGESPIGLQIRLAEGLLRIQNNDKKSLVYQQTIMPDTSSLSDTYQDEHVGVDRIKILRLDVQGRIAHGSAFLELYDYIDETIHGWPIESRACRIEKTADKRLKYHCVIDAYHWMLRDSG